MYAHVLSGGRAGLIVLLLSTTTTTSIRILILVVVGAKWAHESTVRRPATTVPLAGAGTEAICALVLPHSSTCAFAGALLFAAVIVAATRTLHFNTQFIEVS